MKEKKASALPARKKPQEPLVKEIKITAVTENNSPTKKWKKPDKTGILTIFTALPPNHLKCTYLFWIYYCAFITQLKKN